MTPAEREELLSLWASPSSNSEKEQQDRAERMVRDAIESWSVFNGVNYRIYTKGSYPNNTNVRADSDVDVVVECHEVLYYDYADSVTGDPSPTSPYQGPWTPPRWRSEIGEAMVHTFGCDAVDTSGKIAVNISAVAGSRPSADVVPSFDYHLYLDPARRIFHEGSCVFDTTGKKIVNWPAQQLENGRRKNTSTGGRYKRFIRVLKSAENRLAELGHIDDMPSYFMECLVWNVPNDVLVTGSSLSIGFQATLASLWSGLDDGAAHRWKEPNEIKRLFRTDAKWSVDDAKALVLATWRYLEYSS